MLINVVLLVIYILVFIVTSPDISQLCTLDTNILPEAICCCLQTSNVYGAWVTLYGHLY